MSRIVMGWSLSAPASDVYHIQIEPHSSLSSLPTVPIIRLQGRERNLLAYHRRSRDSKHLSFWGTFWALRDAYVQRMNALLREGALSPGQINVLRPDGTTEKLSSGAYLCCNCSPERAHSNLCHRLWAAPFLEKAGWKVTVDGYRANTLKPYHLEVTKGEEEWEYHLRDLGERGVKIQSTRQPINHPSWQWWRIGARLQIGGATESRVWGEHLSLEKAYHMALRSLRLWATNQDLPCRS